MKCYMRAMRQIGRIDSHITQVPLSFSDGLWDGSAIQDQGPLSSSSASYRFHTGRPVSTLFLIRAKRLCSSRERCILMENISIYLA